MQSDPGPGVEGTAGDSALARPVLGRQGSPAAAGVPGPSCPSPSETGAQGETRGLEGLETSWAQPAKGVLVTEGAVGTVCALLGGGIGQRGQQTRFEHNPASGADAG